MKTHKTELTINGEPAGVIESTEFTFDELAEGVQMPGGPFLKYDEKTNSLYSWGAGGCSELPKDAKACVGFGGKTSQA